MSECVVRMEMPKNCYECPFSVIDDAGIWCNGITNQAYGCTERDEDCPIICAIPENHGRLVDADELRDEWFYESNVLESIDYAPTIVPAERRANDEAD